MALVAVTIGGCRPPGPDASVEVPLPDLSGVEPMVADHLRAVHAEAQTAFRKEGMTAEQRAEALGEAGRAFHAHGFHDAAVGYYDLAAELLPTESKWPYHAGHVRIALGNFEAALGSLERVVELDPGFLPGLLTLAEVARQLDRFDLAESVYRRALEREPAAAAAHDGLGRVALARGDPERAVAELREALRLAPDANEPYYPLALALRELGQREEAVEALARRGERRIAIADPWMSSLAELQVGTRLALNRGTAALERGDYDQAIREYRMAVESAPSSALARTNLASALEKMGDTEGAIEAMRAALEIDATLPRANFGMGSLLARSGADAQAVEYYERALAVEPNHRDAMFNLANALYRLRRFDGAVQWYRRSIAADPSNAVAWHGVVAGLARAGSWAEARAEAEAAFGQLPAAPPVQNALIRLLAAAPDEALRDGARALGLARPLFGRDPSLVNVEALAMALAENGLFEEAVQYQQAAVAAVKAAGSGALERHRGLLESYQARRPCRQPW